jgi:pimeloyl-ACP methyl ester carboxylesterase
VALGEATSRAMALLCAAVLLAGCDVLRPSPAGDPATSEATAPPLAATKQVTAHGRHLTTRCAGDPKHPAVLLVSGYDTDLSDAWDDVQPGIGAFARVCAYDRPGVGGSDKPPAQQTFTRMAADLDVVLNRLALRRPVVLVAHSLGGMVAITWAEAHADDVAGVVLVDATPPSYAGALLDLLPATGKGADLRKGYQQLLQPTRNAEHLDGAVAFQDATSFAPLGAVPLIALTHSVSDQVQGLRGKDAAALDSAWLSGQQEWAALSSQGQVQVVDLAGHFIQRDQPRAVIDAVRAVVAGRAKR